MNLTDTHSHLYEPEFDADREEALARAAEAGVERLLLPAIDSGSHERLFGLCRRHPGRCVPMMGLHPTSVNGNPRWREEAGDGRTPPANPARRDSAFLRRGRDRSRPLLEPGFPGGADGGLPAADRPGAAIRPARGRPHPRGVARDAGDRPGVPRPRPAGRLPRLFGHGRDLPRTAHAGRLRLRHRRRGDLQEEPPGGNRARNGACATSCWRPTAPT